jgi:hypothetical protein
VTAADIVTLLACTAAAVMGVAVIRRRGGGPR